MQIISFLMDIPEYVEKNLYYKKEDVENWFIDEYGKLVIILKKDSKKIKD